jgi:hypothetical protein
LGHIAEYKAILSYPLRPTQSFTPEDLKEPSQPAEPPRLKPDIIILSYALNDIEDAAYVQGLGWFRPPPSSTNPIIQNLSNQSFVFNLLYWTIYLQRHPDLGQTYWNYLTQCYYTPEIWKIHQNRLLDLIHYARSNHIDLIVVVFPELRNIEGSKAFTSNVVGFLKDNDVAVIDLASLLTGRNPMELIVQPLDGHPSVKLHSEVADLLLRQIAISKP